MKALIRSEADQVKSLDRRVRKAEFICKLPRETTNEVLDKLATLMINERQRTRAIRIG